MNWVRSQLAIGLQLCGVIGVSVGFGLLAEWAGVIAGGLSLVALGVAVEVADLAAPGRTARQTSPRAKEAP